MRTYALLHDASKDTKPWSIISNDSGETEWHVFDSGLSRETAEAALVGLNR
jgi:hypothetical protein